MNIVLTDAALSDIQSIRCYTLENWGSEQESAYLESLWQKFEEISAQPKQFRYREDLFPGCQLAPAGKHVILFSIHADTLQVVRVLHSAMDYPRHLP